MDFWLNLVLIVVFGFTGGAFMGWLVNWRLELKFSSLKNKLASGDGTAGRAEADAEMASAMAFALELHGQNKSFPEIIKEVAMKHPSVAIKFAKMFLSGKLRLPAGLNGGGGLSDIFK